MFNVILYLIEHKNRVVSRQELLDTIWKDKVVADSSISNHIKSARKVLDDDGIKQAVIKTIHGRGYQFVALCQSETGIDSIQTSLKDKHNKRAIYLLLALVLFSIVVYWNYFKKIDGSSANKQEKTIAVLAFKDMSENSDQAYFSDGISEELLNLLTRIPNLKVASRTSSFSFKLKDMTSEDIGKNLNVNYIIEGSVRKSGEKVRTTVQLIQTKDGSHLWSKTYDHTLNDVFKIQDNIAMNISKLLELTLSGATNAPETISNDAHSLYLKALYYYIENSAESLSMALKIIEDSIDLDNNFAPSWTLKSRIFYKMASSSYDKDNQGLIKLSKESVTAAKQIDASYATASAQMALLNLLEYDFDSARFNIDIAISSKNKDSETIDVIANYLLLTGQVENGVEMLLEDIDVNPISDNHFLQISMGYLFFNQLKDVKSVIKKYRFFYPNSLGGNWVYYYHLIATKNHQQASDELLEQSNEFWQLTLKAYLNFTQGNRQEANRHLNSLITDYPFAPMHIAVHYSMRNDYDNTFYWLEDAYQKHNIEFLLLINHPAFRVIWSDPRWIQLLNDIKLPSEHWLLDRELIESSAEPTNGS